LKSELHASKYLGIIKMSFLLLITSCFCEHILNDESLYFYEDFLNAQNMFCLGQYSRCALKEGTCAVVGKGVQKCQYLKVKVIDSLFQSSNTLLIFTVSTHFK
jgi:hypothetical protein